MTALPKLWDMFKDLAVKPGPPTKKAKQLCSDLLGGRWADVSDDDFDIGRVSGGMTNLMFKCTLNVAPAGIEPSTVLLRIQCEKDMMQQQNEIAMFIELANAGLGPRLLGIFPGGRLEEFVPSRMLTYEETTEPRYSNHVAEIMARIHHLTVPTAKGSQVIPTMRDWLVRNKRNGGTSWKLWSKSDRVPTDNFPAEITTDDIAVEIDRIEQYLTASKSPAYFTHNDLFAANILLKEGFSIDADGSRWREINGSRESTDDDALLLIDFEFGMYNYRGFDVGNHLNELAMTYFEEEPTYTMSLSKAEDDQGKASYCRSYLRQTYKILKTSEQLLAAGLTGDLEADTVILMKEVRDFQAIANFWWGVWNIVCVQEDIIGLDYENAFRDRLCLYYHLKTF